MSTPTTTQANQSDANPSAFEMMEIKELIQVCLQLQAQEKELNKRADELKKLRQEAESYIKAHMQESGYTQTRTEIGTATLVEKTVHNVTNWDAFYEYIYEKKAGYLLQRRVSSTALQEAIEMENVPGVEKITLNDVSVSAIKPKH